MLDKLQQIAQKYDEIARDLSDPAVISDQEKYRTLSKEYKTLSGVVEKFRKFQKTEAEIKKPKNCSKNRWKKISGKWWKKNSGTEKNS